MRFSTLMPSSNYARYIAEAVDSALAQRECAEVIVQDACSSDGTLDVLTSRSDERILVASEPDQGQSDALNRAFARATGDVITWLNADEFYLPEAFRFADRVMSALPQVKVLYGDVVFMDEEGRFLRLVGRIPPSRRALQLQDCYISTCSTFFRRDIEPGFHLDPTLRRVMDWDLYLRWMDSDVQFAYVPVPFAAYRMHSGQVTHHDRSSMWSRRITSRLHAEQLGIRRRYGQPGSGWATIPFLAAGDIYYRYLKTRARSRDHEADLARFVGQDLSWSGRRPSPALHDIWTTSLSRWEDDGRPVWTSPRTKLSLQRGQDEGRRGGPSRTA